ncbi:cell wall-active antibiotics response protein [bacterium]|nr:cell wall-active antibiotics response protein [bacterium]
MKRWQIILGVFLVLLGLFSLVELFFQFNPWRYLFPLLLIALGVWLILRPKITGREIKVETPILGDVRKTGVWDVSGHEIWLFAGDVRLDFSQANFPGGDALVRIVGFVSEVHLVLPENIGLRVDAAAIVSEVKSFDSKQERFLTGVSYRSPGYESAEKRIKLETIGFVSEVKVKRPLM